MKTEPVNTVMGPMEWGLIILLSILWGASFFFVEVAVKTMTPLTIVLCRVGLAALALHGFVIFTNRRLPNDPKIWLAFFVLGALNNVLPFSLIAWGQSHIDSSLAAILNATTPIFSVVLAHFLTRDERLTPLRVAGVALGWAGVAVLIGVDALSGVGMRSAGQAAVLCAAFSYSIAAVFGRRLKALDPVVVATGMLTASTVILLPLVFIFDSPLSLAPTIYTWICLVSLAVVSTAVAYIIYFYILAKAGATNILLVTFFIPVSAMLLGVIFLHETIGWNLFAGMGLIFSGLIFIDGRLVKSGKKRP